MFIFFFFLFYRFHLRSFFFFFNDTATTEIYTLSLHDALPILVGVPHLVIECDDVSTVDVVARGRPLRSHTSLPKGANVNFVRSEEHTSELQSPCNLVCRLLLEKKKQNTYDLIRLTNVIQVSLN